MSAGVLRIASPARPAETATAFAQEKAVQGVTGWSEEGFAREQIRGLVRQVFTCVKPQVRQVVFSSVDAQTEVSDVCWQVGEALAAATAKEIALVVASDQQPGQDEVQVRASVRDSAKRLDANLWSVPIPDRAAGNNAASLHKFLAAIRAEFEYSIVAASPAGPAEVSSVAQFADGIILVLSALRTRRVAAHRLLDRLSHARLLGTVLKDREFPIPEAIYRRL